MATMKEITYAQAINDAMCEEMQRDENVFMMGEDIAEYCGAFGVSRGMLEKFGKDRIMNTPISEQAYVGAGIGAAMAGMRPIVELMFSDFMCVCFDELVNEAPKMRFMFGGKVKVPMVMRTAAGAGTGAAAQHSQSLEACLAHFPGLKVVIPSTPYDAKGLLVPQVRNSENNRRFYHFDQVYPLATIRYLRRLDYSLAQIKAFLHSNGLRDNLQMLSQQAQQLRRQCDELNATIQIIQQKVEFIEREQAVSQRDKFYVRSFPRRAFLHIGEEINLFTHELFYFYPTVGFYQGQRKWFGAYLYEDTPAEARHLPDLMADQPVSYIPAGDYLCGYHYGPYLTIQDSIDRLFGEAYRRKLPVDDCVITPNIVDQCCEGHPDNYITGLEVRILSLDEQNEEKPFAVISKPEDV